MIEEDLHDEKYFFTLLSYKYNITKILFIFIFIFN